jgi:Txe/YoeB family toxin of Txe-Axe toxin-antitoxin module
MYRSWETNHASKDWEKIKSMPKSVKDKYKYLLVDILENPRNLDTVGNPEQLKHTKTEKWSRKQKKKDRIVYSMEPGADYNMPEEPEIVVFYQYLGHYQDK